MDKELDSARLNINQIASITGLHRQTVSARLRNVSLAPGSNPKLKLFTIPAILTELIATGDAVQIDVDKMLPPDRKAWFQSERERLKFQQETSELIHSDEVSREISSMAKAVVQVLETLPDILERDCALNPSAVARVQTIIDDLRDQLAQKVFEADTPEQEEAQSEER